MGSLGERTGWEWREADEPEIAGAKGDGDRKETTESQREEFREAPKKPGKASAVPAQGVS